MKKPLDEQIDNIMRNFDFMRVRETMKATHWVWRDAKESPSLDDLKQHALVLLREVADPGKSSVSCGGFSAWKDRGLLRLEFVVESWEGDM